MSLEINVSFLIPKRCNEVIHLTEKYVTTAYCIGKISENYKLSNTEHHGYTGGTLHYIHDVPGSSRCPETVYFVLARFVSGFPAK